MIANKKVKPAAPCASAAAAYMRYSSDNQNENSIEYQRQAIQAYCDRKGLSVVKEYVDEAFSGTNDKRPAFQQMIAEAANHPPYSMILVYDYSRYARNTQDAMYYNSLLEDDGIHLVSVTQQYGTGSDSDLMIGLTYLMDERASRKIGEHTHSAMKSIAESAQHCGGLPPLGYDVGIDGKLVINEEEAAIVHTIFDMYENNYSYARMADYLNGLGCKTKRGTAFQKSSFNHILQQEKYVGEYYWNRAASKKKGGKNRGKRNSHSYKPEGEQVHVSGGCPAIIEWEQFERVQKQMAERSQGLAKSKSRIHYMLGGLGIVRCAECGSDMVGESMHNHGKSYTIYSCPNHRTHQCKNKGVRTDVVDFKVIEMITDDLREREDWEQIVNLMVQDSRTMVLDEKLKKVEHTIASLYAKLDENFGQIILTKIQKLEAERDLLQTQVEEYRASCQQLIGLDRDELCSKFGSYILTSENPKVKNYLKAVIPEVTVGCEKVTVKYTVE